MRTLLQAPGAVAVAKEPKSVGDKQITFRLSGELHARLDATAEGLELDISHLLRMMIREHLYEYEQRAQDIRRKEGGGKP